MLVHSLLVNVQEFVVVGIVGRNCRQEEGNLGEK